MSGAGIAHLAVNQTKDEAKGGDEHRRFGLPEDCQQASIDLAQESSWFVAIGASSSTNPRTIAVTSAARAKSPERL